MTGTGSQTTCLPCASSQKSLRPDFGCGSNEQTPGICQAQPHLCGQHPFLQGEQGHCHSQGRVRGGGGFFRSGSFIGFKTTGPLDTGSVVWAPSSLHSVALVSEAAESTAGVGGGDQEAYLLRVQVLRGGEPSLA